MSDLAPDVGFDQARKVTLTLRAHSAGTVTDIGSTTTACLHGCPEGRVADVQPHDGFHARIVGFQREACRFKRAGLGLKTLGLSLEHCLFLCD